VGRPAFSSDGRCLALVQYFKKPQEDPQIVIYDAQTGDRLTTIEVGQADPSYTRYFVEPVFRPDGKLIAVLSHPAWPRGSRIAEPGPSRLRAWDVATGKQSLSVAINPARSADELHYSQDGASLVLGTKAPPTATAEFYDATTGARQKLVSMPSSADNYFINIPHQMFGAIVDSDFVMWDLATGQERLRLPGYNEFSHYAISPDGSRLVQGKGDYLTDVSEFTFWSLKSGRPLLTFTRPGYLTAISFSSDGNRLIAAISQSGPSPVKPIQIWDATPLPEEDAK
jgi:WD40 repeat protein